MNKFILIKKKKLTSQKPTPSLWIAQRCPGTIKSLICVWHLAFVIIVIGAFWRSGDAFPYSRSDPHPATKPLSPALISFVGNAIIFWVESSLMSSTSYK